MKKIILLAFLFFAGPAFSSALKVDPAAGHTMFVAVGKPAMLRIKGESPGPKGDLTLDAAKVSGTLSLALEQLKTGIDTRDEHMKKKYLEIEKFPTAELTVKDLDVSAAKAPGKASIKFAGTLKLHGVTKPVEGTADVETTADTYKVVAKTHLNLTDYSIEIPSYAGIKVADTVDLEISFDTKK